MQEPFKKTYIVDETRGLNSLSPSTSLNIATFIVSPTGPVERTTVTSQNDLLNRFLSGNQFSPNDHTTIQHIGSLVTDTPVDVIRVDSSMLREGLTSSGLRVFTDKNFNLIDYYTKVDLNESIPDMLPIIWAKVKYNANTYCFYAGVEPQDLPSNINGSFKVVDDRTDVAGFMANLNASITENIPEVTSAVIATASNSAILVDSYIPEISGLANYQSSQIVGTTQLSCSNTNSDSTNYVKQGEYIKLGGNTLYYEGDGTSSTSNMINPIPISTMLNDVSKEPACEYLIAVENEVLKNSDIQNPLGLSGNYTLGIRVIDPVEGVADPTVELVTSDNLAKYILKTDVIEDDTYNGTDITALASMELLKSGYISVSNNGTTVSFYFGTDVPENVGTGYNLGTDIRTAQKFLSEVRQIIANGSIAGILTGLEFQVTSTAMSLIYQTENEPGLGVKCDVITYGTQSQGYTRISYATSAQATALQKYSDLYMNIGDYTFYIGDFTKISDAKANKVKLSASALTISEFIDELVSAASVYYTLGQFKNGLIIQADSAEGVKITATEGLISGNLITFNQNTINDKFAVIARFPSDANLDKFSYVRSEDGTYNLTLTYKGTSEDYTISFDPNAIDGYGQSIYYGRLNAGSSKSDAFYFLELNGDSELNSYSSNLFGGYLSAPEVSATAIIEAINKYADVTDKYYDYIWDAGYCDPVVSRAFAALTDKTKSEYVMSFPFNYTKASQFIDYRESVGANNYQCYALAPSFRDSTLGTFLSKLSHSLTFLRLIVNNFNSVNSEFAPPFSASKARVSSPNITVEFSKSDREKLLDYQINSVIPSTVGYHINFNLTMQKENSYMSEEQNVHMTNVIAHEADRYSETLIADYNDESLWNRVITELSGRLVQRLIANKSPAPAGLRVVMDAELNNQKVIDSRQAVYEVWVQYRPSIAYVRCYVKVMKLNSF